MKKNFDPGALALLPFGIFLLFYLGLSLWSRDFYAVPMPMAFIVASAAALIMGRDSLEDKIEGLELGADDYLPKPFYMAELHARIKSVMRRGAGAVTNTMSAGNITLYLDSRRVKVDGKELPLLKKEFDILLYFMQRPKHIVDKAILAEAVWGDHIDMVDNFQFVYAQIKNLRKKLTEANADTNIKAVYGFGYKFTGAEE